MVRVLVLYTDYRYETLELCDKEDFEIYVDGKLSVLQTRHEYPKPGGKGKHLLCIVNRNGLIGNLRANPWATFLDNLGVELPCGMFVYGNVIVLAVYEKDVDPYIVDLVNTFLKCPVTDEHLFYQRLKESCHDNCIKVIGNPLIPITNTTKPNEPYKQMDDLFICDNCGVSMTDAMSKRNNDVIEGSKWGDTSIICGICMSVLKGDYDDGYREAVSNNVITIDESDDDLL